MDSRETQYVLEHECDELHTALVRVVTLFTSLKTGKITLNPVLLVSQPSMDKPDDDPIVDQIPIRHCPFCGTRLWAGAHDLPAGSLDAMVHVVRDGQLGEAIEMLKSQLVDMTDEEARFVVESGVRVASTQWTHHLVSENPAMIASSVDQRVWRNHLDSIILAGRRRHVLNILRVRGDWKRRQESAAAHMERSGIKSAAAGFQRHREIARPGCEKSAVEDRDLLDIREEGGDAWDPEWGNWAGQGDAMVVGCCPESHRSPLSQLLSFGWPPDVDVILSYTYQGRDTFIEDCNRCFDCGRELEKVHVTMPAEVVNELCATAQERQSMGEIPEQIRGLDISDSQKHTLWEAFFAWFGH